MATAIRIIYARREGCSEAKMRRVQRADHEYTVRLGVPVHSEGHGTLTLPPLWLTLYPYGQSGGTCRGVIALFALSMNTRIGSVKGLLKKYPASL
jgi:hypothetical protein